MKSSTLTIGPPDDGPRRMCCTYRETGDDFFCLRYRVWYASIDCAFRTRFRTAPGCLDCQQGRFNMKRHLPRLRGRRFDVPGLG